MLADLKKLTQLWLLIIIEYWMIDTESYTLAK